MKLTRSERKARRKRIWNAVKNFFKNIDDHILPQIIDGAQAFMTGFKKVIDSGVVDMATQFIIPGDKDDKAVAVIRATTDKMIEALEITELCLDLPTWEEKILCLANYYKTLSPKKQLRLKNDMHAEYMAALDGDAEKPYEQYYLASNGDFYGSKQV